MQMNLFDEGEGPEAQRAREIYLTLKSASHTWETTAVQETRKTGNPFRTLIASMLSARSREEQTREATEALFSLADNPTDMGKLSREQIETAIDPVQYHERKAGYVLEICAMLDEQGGEVPRTVDDLTKLPGVGWKSAVLTLWIAFEIADEICVDVHVARIGKRLGFVPESMKSPEAISRKLMKSVPQEFWGQWNPLMVRFGREVCFYDVPQCSVCPVFELCPRVGVGKHV